MKGFCLASAARQAKIFKHQTCFSRKAGQNFQTSKPSNMFIVHYVHEEE